MRLSRPLLTLRSLLTLHSLPTLRPLLTPTPQPPPPPQPTHQLMSAFDPPPVPASLVRLATSLHQYAPGHIQNASKLSFSTSFKSAGMHHPQTAALLKQLDATRVDLATALTAGDSQTVVDTCTRYLPLIKRLLLSCEVQPDSAVLDERLNFKWQGGLDGDGTGGLIGKVRGGRPARAPQTVLKRDERANYPRPLPRRVGGEELDGRRRFFVAQTTAPTASPLFTCKLPAPTAARS